MTTLTRMLTVVVHAAEEGGYWAEVLELPGCVSQGETLDEVRKNIREAIESVSEVEVPEVDMRHESPAVEFRLSVHHPHLPQAEFLRDTGTRTASAA